MISEKVEELVGAIVDLIDVEVYNQLNPEWPSRDKKQRERLSKAIVSVLGSSDEAREITEAEKGE